MKNYRMLSGGIKKSRVTMIFLDLNAKRRRWAKREGDLEIWSMVVNEDALLG